MIARRRRARGRTPQSRAAGIGATNEKRCEDALKAEGYSTWRVRRTRFGNMDMFGLFDVVGCHHNPYIMMRFIQVKTNYASPKVIKAIKDFPMPVGCFKEVWVWMSKKGEWKKIDCTAPAGFLTTVITRKETP